MSKYQQVNSSFLPLHCFNDITYPCKNVKLVATNLIYFSVLNLSIVNSPSSKLIERFLSFHCVDLF